MLSWVWNLTAYEILSSIGYSDQSCIQYGSAQDRWIHTCEIWSLQRLRIEAIAPSDTITSGRGQTVHSQHFQPNHEKCSSFPIAGSASSTEKKARMFEASHHLTFHLAVYRVAIWDNIKFCITICTYLNILISYPNIHQFWYPNAYVWHT